MKDTKFESIIKEEFTNEVPDVLENIKQSNRFFVPEKPKRLSVLDIFKLKSLRYSLASTFMIVILAVFFLRGTTENQIYASTVTFDINPQVEITLDEDDVVIGVTILNNDGQDIISQNVEYKGMTLDEFLEYFIGKLEEKGYIISTEDNVMLIHVDGVSEETKARVLAYVEAKITTEANKRNQVINLLKTNEIALTTTQKQAIARLSEQYDINPGRLILIYKIRAVDDSYKISDLSELTMKELNQILLDVSPENPYSNNNNNQNQDQDKKQPNN